MPEIHVHPDEVTVPLDSGATLLEMAVDAGVPITHLCGARARCSTCRIRVVEGLESLNDRNPAETVVATRLDFPDEVRLACQTTATASVSFWRLVLDKIDVQMASQLGKAQYAGPVGREVKDAAVLFADVAGFTTMSENLPAYDVVHLLNRFFNRASEAIESNGGRVVNYMGDGLLAVFGIDDDGGTVRDAVISGIDLLDVAADMHDYVSLIYEHDFKVRVGIDVGELIFGLMGGENSATETVIGDVVNTASRLEAANKATGTTMLVTERVKALVGDGVEYGDQFELDLKGKDGLVSACEVVDIAGREAD